MTSYIIQRVVSGRPSRRGAAPSSPRGRRRGRPAPTGAAGRGGPPTAGPAPRPGPPEVRNSRGGPKAGGGSKSKWPGATYEEGRVGTSATWVVWRSGSARLSSEQKVLGSTPSTTSLLRGGGRGGAPPPRITDLVRAHEIASAARRGNRPFFSLAPAAWAREGGEGKCGGGGAAAPGGVARSRRLRAGRSGGVQVDWFLIVVITRRRRQQPPAKQEKSPLRTAA